MVNGEIAPITSVKNASKPVALGRCITVMLGCAELQSTQRVSVPELADKVESSAVPWK